MNVFDDPNYRADHGIKGQKWGQRRFQNKDGSLTVEGKLRRIQTKTKSGESLVIQEQPKAALAKFLGRHSEEIKKAQDKTFNADIYDKTGKKVGNIELYDEDNDSLNLTWIGINDSARGKGYAQAALDSSIEYAKKNGYRQMTLEVPGNSPDARHIYEKKGFVAGETLSDDDVWGGLTKMTLKLDKAKHSTFDVSDLYRHYIF